MGARSHTLPACGPVGTASRRAQDLAEIERAASAIQVEGERYPEQLMATTGL